MTVSGFGFSKIYMYEKIYIKGFLEFSEMKSRIRNKYDKDI